VPGTGAQKQGGPGVEILGRPGGDPRDEDGREDSGEQKEENS